MYTVYAFQTTDRQTDRLKDIAIA